MILFWILYFVIGYLLCWFTWNLALVRENKKRLASGYTKPKRTFDILDDWSMFSAFMFFFAMLGVFPCLIFIWIEMLWDGHKMSTGDFFWIVNKPMNFLVKEIVDPKNNVKE